MAIARLIRDYAEVWHAADKVAYSKTLSEPSCAKTRIEPEFDPAAVARLKETAERDLGIGGPNLAAQTLAAGLIDECHLFLSPVIVGAGTRALPNGLKLRLDLLDEHRFGQ